MSHGLLRTIGPMGMVYLVGSTAFFAYLAQSFKGPEEPKFRVPNEIVDIAKKTQPGIVPEHYYLNKPDKL